MIKLNTQSDKSSVDKFISNIQKEFPDYDVDVNNVIDFSIALEEKRNCQSCKGLASCKNATTGCCYKYNEKEDTFEYKVCDKQKNETIKKNTESLIKTLYLPEKVLDASFESFELTSPSRKKIMNNGLEFIRDFNEGNIHKGLYIYGSFSIGKTYALACIANELAKNNINSLLIYFPDLVVDLKNAIGTPRFESLINMLKSVDVLMLDDIGSENMSPWLRDEIIGPIINYRLSDRKALFVSSNVSPNELKECLLTDKMPQTNMKAERIISRLNSLMNTISMDDGNKYKR